MENIDIRSLSELISNPSWDIIVLFFFVAVGFFYGISAGKAKLISFLLSLYVAGSLFENFSYLVLFLKKRTILEIFFIKIFIFLVLLIFVNILLIKIFSSSFTGNKRWWQTFLLSFLASGLLFSYFFHLFPTKGIFTFSPIVSNFFASDNAFFLWLILPLVALFFSRR
ncbi:MAG: hypothetical protein AB1643_02755 [Patescibacteria group bacterium]